MIKKLRRKIIFVLMTIFSSILIGVLININVVNYKQSISKSYMLIEKIIESNGDKSYYFNDKKENEFGKGRFDDFSNKASFRMAQFYTVKVDFEGNVSNIINENTSGYSDDEIESLTFDILQKNKDEGTINSFLYVKRDTSYGKIIVLLDNSLVDENNSELIKNSIVGGGLGMVVLFLIAFFLSKWIVKPVKEVFEKQKQFISDASHELKTPLTVISANADILENDIGENKWLSYIKSEAFLMSSLVNKLLNLANMESVDTKTSYSKINLSKAVYGGAIPFESVAFEKDVTLNYRIEDNIYIRGDECEIKQVVSILLDNALKHVSSGGHIVVSLNKVKNKVILKAMNDGGEISEVDREKIFERFYRGDKSRKRDSHRYGLGLAIGKAIIEKHKGTIDVECNHGWTRFIITFNSINRK